MAQASLTEEAIAIVRALAAERGNGECPHPGCDWADYLDYDDLEQHVPDCPFRRAVEWVRS